MKAVIVGAGKVGFNIAQILSQEGHSVIVIDINEARLTAIEQNLDVQTISGNGASAEVLREAGIREADLLVAVTERDELNMVSCFIAKSYGVARTIARVRNPEYVEMDEKTKKEQMGIDLIINPERVTAEEIAKLITVPEAQNVEYYADGKVQLLELKIAPKYPITGTALKDLAFPHPALIVAVLRQGKMIIPRGNERILADDVIYVMAKTKEMVEIEKFLGQNRLKIENIVILGGGRIGYYLAQKLENKRFNIKIVEKSMEKCKVLAQKLNHSLILHADGTDLQMLEEENVGDTDLFVAVTGDDKVNLLVSLLAKHLGAKKTIAQIRRSDYASLVEKVGVDRAISPRRLTAGAILRFIRLGKVLSITLLSDARAEILEIIVPSDTHYAGKQLKDIGFPSGAIVGAIVRHDQVIVPTGHDNILAGDHIIVFALPGAVAKVEDFLQVN